MARLTYAYRADDEGNLTIGRRQFPIIAGDNLMMLMELNAKGGLCIDSPQIRGKELEEFTRKFNLLSSEELRRSLEIDKDTLFSVLNQCVQCVGCRRRVEHLFIQLTSVEQPTLDPLVLKKSRILTVNEEKMKTPQALGTLLYRHHEIMNNIVDTKLRNKTRCVLHSLDAFRSKPFSESWREVWTSMKQNCRDELAVIDMTELHEVLETYLKKHKFCQGCRTKIEKAYKILVGETTTKEKGYVAALYANIKKCHTEKHIHVCNRIDFLDALIRRAEPEVNGSYTKQRERHAKTLEIAQEEVLTCVGMIMYERLRRIYISLREEERACQVLAAVGVHALYRRFDIFVEKKQGISNLELLYREIQLAEKAKQHKREQKKLKKKKKKIEKRINNSAGAGVADSCEDDEGKSESSGEVEEVDEEGVDETVSYVMDECYEEEDEDGGEHEALEEEQTECIPQVKASPTRHEPQKKPSKKSKQKQKKKQKRNKKKTGSLHSSTMQEAEENGKVEGLKRPSNSQKCNDCLAPNAASCPCVDDVRDSGYGSDRHSSHAPSRTPSVISTPEGSEVSCSDGCCNHPPGGHDEEQSSNLSSSLALSPSSSSNHSQCHCGNDACDLLFCHAHNSMHTLSMQIVDESYCSDEGGDENCYIPEEVILLYQCQREKVQQERQKLRETLRENFARLRKKQHKDDISSLIC